MPVAWKVVGGDYYPCMLPSTCPPWLNRSMRYTVGATVVDTTTSGMWASRTKADAVKRWSRVGVRKESRVVVLEYDAGDVATGPLIDASGTRYWHRSMEGRGVSVRLLRAKVVAEIPRTELELLAPAREAPGPIHHDDSLSAEQRITLLREAFPALA